MTNMTPSKLCRYIVAICVGVHLGKRIPIMMAAVTDAVLEYKCPEIYKHMKKGKDD